MNAGDDLEAFARRLSAVVPAAPEVGRDELMFAAGRAAGSRGEAKWRRQLRLWQGACGFLVMAGVGLALVRPGALPPAALDGGAVRQEAVMPGGRGPAMTPGHGVPPGGVSLPLVSGGMVGGVRMGERGETYLQIRRQAELVGVSTLLLLKGENGRLESLPSKAGVPALRQGEGLDAVPTWQRETVFGGDRS